MTETTKPGWAYRALKSYTRFLAKHVYYRTYRIEGKENVPAPGVPTILASNHQNGAMDILSYIYAFDDRKPYVITREDAVNLWPSLFMGLGMLPTVRSEFGSSDDLGKNDGMMDATNEALKRGETVIIMPEGENDQGHMLMDFSSGYTKMAFEAAASMNFEQDVVILPAAHHYSGYYGIRVDAVFKFLEPVSLKPYYELYKVKPRTAQREVNAIVRERIESAMLRILDEENYESIDFIRTTYGLKYASAKNRDTSDISVMRDSDKEFCSRLEEQPEDFRKDLYAETESYMEELKAHGLDDNAVAEGSRPLRTLAKVVVMALLFPLWVVSLWPGAVGVIPSEMFPKKMPIGDTGKSNLLMWSTFLFVTDALFFIPIGLAVTIPFLWGAVGAWAVLGWLMFLVPLMRFSDLWWKWAKIVRSEANATIKGKIIARLRKRREAIYMKLNGLYGLEIQ